MADGRLSYYKVRTFAFNPTFRLPDEDGALVWTPCREEADNDPQSERIVVDQRWGVLYVGFETIGLYAVRLGHPADAHASRISGCPMRMTLPSCTVSRSVKASGAKTMMVDPC